MHYFENFQQRPSKNVEFGFYTTRSLWKQTFSMHTKETWDLLVKYNVSSSKQVSVTLLFLQERLPCIFQTNNRKKATFFATYWDVIGFLLEWISFNFIENIKHYGNFCTPIWNSVKILKQNVIFSHTLNIFWYLIDFFVNFNDHT